MGGGNGIKMKHCAFREGLSPRGRGKPRRIRITGSKRRSIPAWAGETGYARFYEREI